MQMHEVGELYSPQCGAFWGSGSTSGRIYPSAVWYQQIEGAVVDRSVLQAGENSPEHVAYRLMECIADVEGMSLSKSGKEKLATRKWILDAYAESLDAVRANRRYNKPQT